MKAASCSTTDSVGVQPDSTAFPESFQLPLIALDIGTKRIGVAVCDRLALTCRGVACLHRKDTGWPQQLMKIIREYGSRGIVAGLPKNMDGTQGAQADDARAAVARLAKVTDMPIAFQDERLSTWTAKERLFAQGLSEKKVKEKLDQTAAAVILEDFIAAHPQLKR
ncbi:MAG: Holliday junction resolvase RuvX [Zetaproteobacteria bacterium CG_4_9_14_3_um_filter_49_83]|nr:MAG: Holliday junction resolvase RuvX [Zetaproteobacteria bacterium CG17_big_fil_post_rev_8_21_14_2_50_50_13]PIV29369.1 MAG: Holliday junction resolvase RuvX [Zetaproteobacteria bacterium CG02_land_8_20_14_3_00_50_9]PIY54803.1 MAG: Holliday junction resolvase RuvX [Zetaproteobacteria bacterium CG_4_10_14_0_8_um_filter_49_80]PJA33669.1 MAG: Holliday junction resolvase RuvX [Zetaproteobacteria bacterium CG_4_9_14_3_um_filter_49_83]